MYQEKTAIGAMTALKYMGAHAPKTLFVNDTNSALPDENLCGSCRLGSKISGVNSPNPEISVHVFDDEHVMLIVEAGNYRLTVRSFSSAPDESQSFHTVPSYVLGTVMNRIPWHLRPQIPLAGISSIQMERFEDEPEVAV